MDKWESFIHEIMTAQREDKPETALLAGLNMAAAIGRALEQIPLELAQIAATVRSK